MTGTPDVAVDVAKTTIESQFGAMARDPSTRELEDLIFWLGARAKPLLPTLRQARSRLTGQDRTSFDARAGLTRCIQSVPND